MDITLKDNNGVEHTFDIPDDAKVSASELNDLLCADGEWRSVDGSISSKDAVAGVLELFPGADKQALCCLADCLTKPKRST